MSARQLPTVGSVLSMTPANGTVEFIDRDEGTSKYLQLVGFGVVVIEVKYGAERDQDLIETQIQALVLAEGFDVMTMMEARDHCVGGDSFRVHLITPSHTELI